MRPDIFRGRAIFPGFIITRNTCQHCVAPQGMGGGGFLFSLQTDTHPYTIVTV